MARSSRCNLRHRQTPISTTENHAKRRGSLLPWILLKFGDFKVTVKENSIIFYMYFRYLSLALSTTKIINFPFISYRKYVIVSFIIPVFTRHLRPLPLHKPGQPLDFAAEGGSDKAESPGVHMDQLRVYVWNIECFFEGSYSPD